MDEITVGEMVVEYLKKNDFDGLVSRCGECSCTLDDLMPCESDDIPGCSAGYKVPCDCGEGCGFHIATQKPTKEIGE